MEYDPVTPKSRKHAAATQAVASKQDDEDFRWLMGHKQGRRLVWQWLDKAGVFRTSFSTNALHMAHLEGHRAAGLALIDRIHTLCPDQYQVMIKEQHGRGD